MAHHNFPGPNRPSKGYDADEIQVILSHIPSDSEDSEFSGEEGDIESDPDNGDSEQIVLHDQNTCNNTKITSTSNSIVINQMKMFAKNTTVTEPTQIPVTEIPQTSFYGKAKKRKTTSITDKPNIKKTKKQVKKTKKVIKTSDTIEWGDLDTETETQYPRFKGQHGHVHLLPADAAPIEFFNQIFPGEMFELITEESNRYKNQKGRKWDDCDVAEIKAFIGILYMMGIHRLPCFDHYFSSDWVLGVPAVTKVFVRNRFWQLWQNLHLADNNNQPQRNSPDFNKLYKIKPMLDILTQSFQGAFNLGQNISVDEHMVKGKGRNPFKQYLPMKPIKRGTKIWEIGCACCAYLYDFQIYTGKANGEQEKGLAHRVVMDLVSPLKDMGHVLYADNFFTSFALQDSLRNIGIDLVGTIRSNRVGFPSKLKLFENKLDKGEYHSVAAKELGLNINVFIWHDTKIVSFISTVHPTTDETRVKRKHRDGTVFVTTCPPCVPDYNKNMGAIDKHDQLIKNYGIDRKSRRYWVRIFTNMLDAAMVNSYILYKENFVIMNMPAPLKPPKVPLNRIQFMCAVIHELIGNFSSRKRKGPTSATWKGVFPVRKQGHTLTKLPFTDSENQTLIVGRCSLCSMKSGGEKRVQRKETSFGCMVCYVRLCRAHCFEKYHKIHGIFTEE